jgi:hypothetical protein
VPSYAPSDAGDVRIVHAPEKLSQAAALAGHTHALTSREALRAALEREFGADVIHALEKAGLLDLTARPADAPADTVGETRGERISACSTRRAPLGEAKERAMPLASLRR